RALYRILLTSVLLPEPDAPVMATINPRGKVTFTDLRLFSRPPRTVSVLPLPVLLLPGVAIARLPDRYWPVGDALHVSRSSTLPCTTTRPPWTPGPGPISTM